MTDVRTPLVDVLHEKMKADWGGKVHFSPLRGPIDAPEVRTGGNTDTILRFAAEVAARYMLERDR